MDSGKDRRLLQMVVMGGIGRYEEVEVEEYDDVNEDGDVNEDILLAINDEVDANTLPNILFPLLFLILLLFIIAALAFAITLLILPINSCSPNCIRYSKSGKASDHTNDT